MQIIRVDFGPEAQQGAEGFVTATKAHDEWHFLAAVGRELPPGDVERFVRWADQICDRMVAYGPAVDGWEPTPDGSWRWLAAPTHRTAS